LALLEIKNLTKRFGGLVAVNNVSFNVDEGKVIGIIGPNGSGKTTLFNLISGIYPADTGNVFFNEKNITGLHPYDICQEGISRTFQLVRPFLNQTALQNVLVGIIYGRRRYRGSLDKATEEAMEILEFLGLSKNKDKLVLDMTVAERKRVEIGRAMATNPRLLMLDEIIAGLNPTETKEFLSLIDDVHRKGVTLLVVEHVMKAVMTISDFLIVLDHGEKIAEGPPSEVVKSKKVVEVYLGEEYVSA